MKAIAYFITPHGFGHATRACAVIESLRRRWPDLRPEIFTQTPAWIFEKSIGTNFGYHPVRTDVGLVQFDALHVDLSATVAQLKQFLPFPAKMVSALARQVQKLGCQMIFCDISPLGVAVARAAGVPSVVVENFTWDWIYQGYLDDAPALRQFVDELAGQFAEADLHIQSEPACASTRTDWPVDLVTAPVARQPRMPAALVREALAIPRDSSMVLITMGGMNWIHSRLDALAEDPSYHFVISGGEATGALPTNVHLLNPNSDYYHPDIVAASNAVIGKIGYSTLAEVYQAGIPYGYIGRPGFRESQVLAAFVEQKMAGYPITVDSFINGEWLESLPKLLALSVPTGPKVNGADQIADFIVGRDGNSSA